MGIDFKFCAPGDQQEDAWILRFCDQDVREMLWTGPEAEADARAAWDRYTPSWNCYLFRLATPLKVARHFRFPACEGADC